jgi:hypothetical protein
MACATVTPFQMPEGPWTPDPSAPGIFEAASASCPSRIRGRVIAGFEHGGALRLEAPAPFGAPIFILVARANRSVLWLPRDRRVLRDAPVEDVLEAIAGLRRSSDDLLALVSGCLTSDSTPGAAGQRSSNGSLMVDLPDATRAFLTRAGQVWRISAGRQDATAARGSWSVSYADFSASFPGSIRVWQHVGAAGQPGSSAELTLRVSQLETNVPIDSQAFELAVPPDAAPLTVDELRQSGPLADRVAGQGSGR